MKKRIFSILLCLCMVLALFPATAFAEEPADITIHGADVVCAQQDYEFTVTAADGVKSTYFVYRCGDYGADTALSPEENGERHGVVPAYEYRGASSIELTVHGTADGTSVTATKTVQISPDHIFVDGVCGCGAKQLTITYEFDYGTLSADRQNPETIVSEPSGTSICLPDLDDCGERQFLGWQVKNSDDLTVYPANEEYAPSKSMTFVAVYDEYITLSVPFTTTVEQGGDVAPGETTFDLAVVGTSAGDMDISDVTVSGSVTTNGAGDYDGELTFTGPFGQLWYMLCEGALVQQVNAGEAGWTYDDTVWGLLMTQDVIEYATRSMDMATGYRVIVVPTVCDDAGNYAIDWESIDWEAPQSEDMRFTNTYTKSTTELTESTEPTEPTEQTEPTKPTEPTNPTESNPNAGATTSPQTGDSSNLTLWFALLAVSAAGVIGIGVYSKRRRNS